MRNYINKKHYTRAERKFGRLLQELHIPFRTKVIIKGREVDFLINGKYAVDIDCHEQDGQKNQMLSEVGYIPIHFSNQEVNHKLVDKLKKLC